MVELRPYEPDDAEGLWACKRAFETGIGEGTGDESKAATYEAKLTDDYRERWLSWVGRCVDEQADCVVVADAGGDAATGETPGADTATGETPGADSGTAEGEDGDRDAEIVGYAFVLPESLAFVWDGAVLNELYVAPDYRGTGVADDLLAAALTAARAQSLPLDRILLDVDRSNERARAFYERHGFEHWGEMVSREL